MQERGVWPERAARYDAGPANPAREQIQVRYRYTGEYTDNKWHDPYGSALRSRGFFCKLKPELDFLNVDFLQLLNKALEANDE